MGKLKMVRGGAQHGGYNEAIKMVRREMSQKEISQRQLADRLGWHPSLISRYLGKNPRRMPAKKLDQILLKLGLGPDTEEYTDIFTAAGLPPERQPASNFRDNQQPLNFRDSRQHLDLEPLKNVPRASLRSDVAEREHTQQTKLLALVKMYLNEKGLKYFIRQGRSGQDEAFLLRFGEAVVTLHFPLDGIRASITLPHRVPPMPEPVEQATVQVRSPEERMKMLELRERVLTLLSAFSFSKLPNTGADPRDGEIQVEFGSLVRGEAVGEIVDTVLAVGLIAFEELNHALISVLYRGQKDVMAAMDDAELTTRRARHGAPDQGGSERSDKTQ